MALAQDMPKEVKARQGQFQIMALNLGILGGMAKGAVEYDAEVAQAAAGSLVGISMVNQGPLWPEGTSELDIDGTRAKVEIWDNLPDVLAKWSDFGTAAKAMQTAAGEGPEAIGQALGQVGGASKACHDAYRAPQG
ncbi:unnamed protein product [Cyprideis torosa]|uniref:Uncharacterized protein n=1 Tax=Cyprideis torosa TaxID=163714 RepID=A0A7R8WVU4_9CRUS|nr:unnamed protein product [Cyprideis torosa]CAG0911098.1 unnamed protein product [Cyprideis torosa]